MLAVFAYACILVIGILVGFFCSLVVVFCKCYSGILRITEADDGGETSYYFEIIDKPEFLKRKRFVLVCVKKDISQ